MSKKCKEIVFTDNDGNVIKENNDPEINIKKYNKNNRVVTGVDEGHITEVWDGDITNNKRNTDNVHTNESAVDDTTEIKVKTKMKMKTRI